MQLIIACLKQPIVCNKWINLPWTLEKISQNRIYPIRRPRNHMKAVMSTSVCINTGGKHPNVQYLSRQSHLIYVSADCCVIYLSDVIAVIVSLWSVAKNALTSCDYPQICAAGKWHRGCSR